MVASCPSAALSAFANLKGIATASSGAHGTVGSGGVKVDAVGVHTVKTETLMVQGGIVTVGLTIARANNGRSTLASVGSTGNISTTGAVLVHAGSTNISDTSQLFPQIAIGGVNITVLVRLATVSGSTKAQVDGDFSNASSIEVSAVAENKAIAPAQSVGVAVVGLTGVFGFAEIASSAVIEAAVGSTSSLGSTGTVKIEAKTADGKENLAQATANSIGAAAISLTALVTEAIVAGAVRAKMDGSITGSTSVTINAFAKNRATATTTVASLGAATLSASGADAEVTNTADVEALVGSGSITTSGNLDVTATSQNTAKGDSDGFSGGVIALSLNLPSSVVGGGTKASFGADVNGGPDRVKVEATSTNNATTTPTVINIGGLFSGAGTSAHAEVTADADTEALVLDTAAITAPGALVTVTATSHNTATAKVTSVSIGGVSIAVMLPTAIVGGATNSNFDGDLVDGVTDALGLTVTTRSTNLASAHIELFSVGVVGGAGAIADAAVTGDTEAGTGTNANIAVSGAVLVDAGFAGDGNKASSLVEITSVSLAVSVTITGAKARVSGALRGRLNGTISSSSQITAQAVGTQTAVANADVLSIGLGLSFNGAASLADITNTADVEVLSDSGSLASGGAILLDARGTFSSTATSELASGGLIAVGLSKPTALIGAGNKALLNASVTSASLLTVKSHGERTAKATVQAAAVGLGAINLSESNATISSDANTDSIIGSGSTVTIGNSNVMVVAEAVNIAQAFTKSSSFGLVTVSIVEPNSLVEAITRAQLNGHVGTTTPCIGPDGIAGTCGVAGAGTITVTASAADRAVTKIESTNFGLITIESAPPSLSEAKVNSDVLAQFGSGHVTASGAITLIAESHTDADMNTDSTAGGAITVQNLRSQVTDTPTVGVKVLAGGLVQSGGLITIESRHGSLPTELSDGVINCVFHGAGDGSNCSGIDDSPYADSVYFTKPHGLITGDTVKYLANGTITGLVSGRNYSVVIRSGQTNGFQLGVEFVPDDGDATPEVGETSIDPATGTLVFRTAHNLNTGDMVWLEYDGALIPGLPAGLYTVFKVDELRLKLRDATTPTTNLSFNPNGAVDGGSDNEITLSGHGLVNGQAVTYHAPKVPTFRAELVDLNIVTINPPNDDPDQGNFRSPARNADGTLQHPNNNNIYLPAHGLSEGQYVRYLTDGTQIPGLTDGNYYRVHVVNADEIQLDGNLTSHNTSCPGADCFSAINIGFATTPGLHAVADRLRRDRRTDRRQHLHRPEHLRVRLPARGPPGQHRQPRRQHRRSPGRGRL